MARYKSDIEIAQEFQDMQVINVDVKPSGKSGWIELHFPHAGDHVGGGAEDITDSWIKYDNDRIAFGNWYPDDTYNALVRVVRQHNDETTNHKPREGNMQYTVTEKQDINSYREGKKIEAGCLAEAKRQASRMQVFCGTVMEIADAGGPICYKTHGQWINAVVLVGQRQMKMKMRREQ